MASITRYRDKWRAQVKVKGQRKSAVFDTKSAAKEWSAKMETLLAETSILKPVKQVSVRDVFLRYADEETPKKRGQKWELTRLMAMCKMPIADVMLPDLSDTDIIKWRDDRLKTVKPSTLLREWTVMSNTFNMAIREWKWMQVNPMSNVKRPTEGPSRERRISQDEIDRLQLVIDWYDRPAKTMSERIMIAFLFAIETAMRAGEIISLEWSNVDPDKRTAFLPMTKNGSSRKVPLSSRATQLLSFLPKETRYVFNLSKNSLDALFRKYRDKAGIENLHFHDTRHEAITRLAKKLDVLDLARMVGHRDLKQLLTYYNATAEELATKLD